jgi:hypothetical protein
VYHVELRQFPHNMCRFNLTDGQLRVIVEPWARKQTVDFGERKWNPEQARITILEGPQLGLDQLKMGRGWRAAERKGEDVTERVLAEAARAASVGAQGTSDPTQATPAPTTAEGGPAGMRAAAGSLKDSFTLGVQLAALLGPDPLGLLEAWRAAAAGSPGLAPSESLAAAERELASRGGQSG